MISAQDFLKQHPISDGMEERYTKPDSSAVGDAGQSACCGVKYAGHASRVRHATDNEDFDPRNFDACREAAFRLLDASARSTQTLRRRLLDKGYEDRTVDDVIERLIELGLLDDEAYARSVVRYCVNRMMGSRGTAMELRRKGVADSIARRVVSEVAAQGAFEEAAWELGRVTARKTRGLDRQVRLRRFWSAGGRKGHDADTLRRVAHELLDD